jgi:hypothetical protein
MRQALNRGSLLQGKIKLASTRGFVSSGPQPSSLGWG